MRRVWNCVGAIGVYRRGQIEACAVERAPLLKRTRSSVRDRETTVGIAAAHTCSKVQSQLTLWQAHCSGRVTMCHELAVLLKERICP